MENILVQDVFRLPLQKQKTPNNIPALCGENWGNPTQASVAYHPYITHVMPEVEI